MDIEHIRERAEYLTLEMLVVMLMRALQASSSPGVASSLRKALEETSEMLTTVHPKGATAEQGDLLMAEMQEAWQRLVARVLTS